MKPIGRHSKGFQLVRHWVKFTLLKLFFQRVEVRGVEKIDPSKAIILAPNHQNALIDAFMAGIYLKQQPVFLTRADIFTKTYVIYILRYLRMLPVYRIRDGFESLKKNEAIFEECINYLSNGNTLILFPEGNHGDKRHFRPLKKGLGRIAFEAESKHNFELGLQIIPVGIDYFDYRKFRGRVSLRFGDPIEMKNLRELYEENPPKALLKLNLLIQKGIEPYMIEIPWMDHYDNIMNIRSVYGEYFHLKSGGSKDKNLLARFDSHKKLISILGGVIEKNSKKIDELGSKIKIYFEKIKKLNLRDHVIVKAPYSNFFLAIKTLGMVLLLPLYLYGLINNYLIFKLPEYFTLTKIKDHQFRSSIAYVMAFIALMPILHIIQTILVAVFTTGWWIPLLYLASLIPSGLFAIHYSFWFKKLRARWKYNIYKAKNNKNLLDVIDLQNNIIESLNKLTAQQ